MMHYLCRAGETMMAYRLRLNGFCEEIVHTRQGSIRTFDACGQGPSATVVVIHGLGGSSPTYAPMLYMLLPLVKRLIALDLPNHGKSVTLNPSTTSYQQPCMNAVTEVLNQMLGNADATIICLLYTSDLPTT